MNNIAEIHEKVYAHLTTSYPDLPFTLRQKNRGGRFDYGYWFTGTDDYLAFSFWAGLDPKNKTPHIFFRIDQYGAATLNFVSYDNEILTKFFTAVSGALRMTQRKRKKTGEGYEHWEKLYENTDYIAVIDNFIENDKKIIDSLISINSNVAESLKPIDTKNFERNKELVAAKRTRVINSAEYKHEWERTKAIYLKSLGLKSIGLFQDISLDFSPTQSDKSKSMTNVVCFIGNNGTGKTTLLRSIVLAFTGSGNTEDEFGGDDTLFNKKSLRNMLSISGVNKEEEGYGRPIYSKRGSVKITYQTRLSDENITPFDSQNKVVLQLDNNTNDIFLTDSLDDVIPSFTNSIDNKYKSLFLAFPQLQSTPNENDKDSQPDRPNINDVISMLNNQPDTRFYKFAKFLVTTQSVVNNEIAKGNKTPPERGFLYAVFDVISDVIDEKIKLHTIIYEIGREDNPIWVKIGENSNPILLELISQGFNNIFGWIGYMMQRLYQVTPTDKKNNFMQTPAIVLIDEIDTYLHISVQQKILAVLVEKFPNIQFIVTTHSPYVLGSIPKDKIKIYVCKKEAESVEIKEFTDFTAYGADIKELSSRIYGIERPVKEIQDEFETLFILLQQFENEPNNNNLADKISIKIARLANILHHADPDLLRAQSDFEMIKILNDMEKEGIAK